MLCPDCGEQCMPRRGLVPLMCVWHCPHCLWNAVQDGWDRGADEKEDYANRWCHTDMIAKKIKVTGFFTEEDWAELVELIRTIEQRHPEKHYECWMEEGDAVNTTEALDMLQRTFVKAPDDDAVFGVIRNPEVFDQIAKEMFPDYYMEIGETLEIAERGQKAVLGRREQLKKILERKLQ